MSYRIERVAQFGDLVVYRRMWELEPGLKRYAVYRDSDGRCLEEFRTRRSAEKWARENGQ